MNQTINNLLTQTSDIEVLGGLLGRFAPVCHCEKSQPMGVSRWTRSIMSTMKHFVNTLKISVAEIIKPDYVAVKMKT
jgi:hypothetical protein